MFSDKLMGFEIHKRVFYLILCVVSFFISLSLLNAHVGGDQINYHALYDALGRQDTSDIASLLMAHVASGEILSGYILWFGASLGFDKNIYISILNVLLILGVVRLVLQSGGNLLVVLLVLTNFYLVVLLTSAERLKFAYLILVWAHLLRGNFSFFLTLLSTMAHFQSLIFLAGVGSGLLGTRLISFIKTFRIKKLYLYYGALAAFGLYFILYTFMDEVLQKGAAYSGRGGQLTEIINSLALLLAALSIAKSKLRYITAVLPISVAAYYLGGDRVNMIAFTVVFYLAALDERLNHPVLIILLAYFSIKSISYVANIYEYGNGFV